MRRWGTNTGHGHVWERPDGLRYRCGGPSLCKECALDAASVDKMNKSAVALARNVLYMAEDGLDIPQTLVDLAKEALGKD